jgi:hypothetical protein
MTRTLIALWLLCSFAGAQEVSADRAAAQSMKYMARLESEKLVQNLQDGDARAILAKLAHKVDYYDKGRISAPAVRAEIEKYFRRWPDRQFSHVDTTVGEWDVYRGLYKIGVEVDFLWTVKDGKTKSGNSRLHLVWQGRTNDDLSIVSWNETTRNPGEDFSGVCYERVKLLTTINLPDSGAGAVTNNAVLINPVF